MIARRAGTFVSLGILCGVISGCGTQLDPRLQPSDKTREGCTYKDKSYSDDEVRGILAKIEQGRLSGITKAHASDKYDLQCTTDFGVIGVATPQFLLCEYCYVACIDQVYGENPLEGL